MISLELVQNLPFIAGHVALDFVNTAEDRGHPNAGDALNTPADLRTWGRRAGLLTEGADDPQELDRAREAREMLYRLFHSCVHETAAAPEDRGRLARLVAEAHRAGELDQDLRWRWSPGHLATVRHVAVTSSLELLQNPARLKQCPGERCGWFFLDATKRGNRRWCSMGECGQDAKTARRRARRRAS